VKSLGLFVSLLLVCSCVMAQTGKRIAFLPANSKFADLENRVADRLVEKFAGRPGLTVTDRQSIEKIIKEQNFQNSDRSSPDTAARIGKIAGAGQIVMVQVDAASYTTQAAKSGSSTTNNGTVILQAHARMIDVESGSILTQPSSSFQDSAAITKVTEHKGVHFGQINTPNKVTTDISNDPKVVENNEVSKAIDAVSSELGSKLSEALVTAPGPKAEPPLVAGIANGSVYINEGSSSGIKVGDHFQITRKVDTGLVDPKTSKPITRTTQICVLTVTSVDVDNASGSCKGSLPQSKDVAEAAQP
jgi:hypothetical protein